MFKSLALGVVLTAAAFPGSAATADTKTIIQGGLGASDSVLFCPKGTTSLALPHFPALSYLEGTVSDGRLVLVEKAWPTATADVHAKLPNTSTEIGTTTTSVEGSIAAIFGLAKTDRSIAIDYIKYRIEPLRDGNSVVAYSRVGVGMRITIDIHGTKANFTGTLQSLAGAVTADKLKGTISAELIGISSADVGMAMPFTADLSEPAVQRIIEAMAVVKSKMFDDKTVIQPQLLSRIECAK